MPVLSSSSESISALAERLGELISARSLKPGDPFLTTAEAAEYLKIRRQKANQALQVLVQRGRITRQQKIGSRVTTPPLASPTLRRVHFLVQREASLAHADYPTASQVGFHSMHPECAVEVHHFSAEAMKAFLEPYLQRARKSPGAEGLVLVRCDYPTQKLVAASGVPAVVHGGTYAGISLPSVDVDSRQMGALQGEALADLDCSQWIVMRMERSLPGDRLFLAGLREAALRRGFPSVRLEEVCLGDYPELVREELEILFSTKQPIGVVCTTRKIAEVVLEAGKECGRQLQVDFFLHCNSAGDGLPIPEYPCLIPEENAEQQGAHLGRLLRTQWERPQGPLMHERIPCRFAVNPTKE